MVLSNSERMAEQQLFGYCSAKKGETLANLVRAMGLIRTEWEHLKTTWSVDYLSDDERIEIDNFFEEGE